MPSTLMGTRLGNTDRRFLKVLKRNMGYNIRAKLASIEESVGKEYGIWYRTFHGGVPSMPSTLMGNRVYNTDKNLHRMLKRNVG